MVVKHTVKSYDEDLNFLNSQITDMGTKVQKQLEDAIKSIINRDLELATKVVEADPEIDALEHEIDAFAIRMIALRQPVAGDLRFVIAALKVSSHLERIADYARNIAKRTIALEDDLSKKLSLRPIQRMAKLAQSMISDILHAFINCDDKMAHEVWNRDVELDDMYTGFLRELLTYMMEDPRNISPATQLLFVAKNIERIGDHATNIAEMVHYFVNGTPFEEPRPKGEGEILT